MFLGTNVLPTDWAISVIQYCIYRAIVRFNEETDIGLNSFTRNVMSKLNFLVKVYSINNYEDVVKY